MVLSILLLLYTVHIDALKWYVAIDNLNPVKTTAGFTSYEVTKQGMVVKFYDQVGYLFIMFFPGLFYLLGL
ncbi:hypothetical protein EON65_07080 [archaeon]|nr:MAG: hypothetical protein EON65_07080 [archaeon]